MHSLLGFRHLFGFLFRRFLRRCLLGLPVLALFFSRRFRHFRFRCFLVGRRFFGLGNRRVFRLLRLGRFSHHFFVHSLLGFRHLFGFLFRRFLRRCLLGLPVLALFFSRRFRHFRFRRFFCLCHRFLG